MGALQLKPDQARRIAIRAQLLDAHRPTDLVEAVRHLTLLQLDPTAVVAPNVDLVAWTRLGPSYRPAELTAALDDRRLFEFNALVRPIEDLPLYLADAADFPTYESSREWFAANDGLRRDILELLGERGPLLSKEIPDTSAVPWRSTGWTGNRNVTQMLEFLVFRGEIAVSGRRGKQRMWDLAERVYPGGLPRLTPDEARRLRDERRLTALGLARARGTAVPVEPAIVGDVGDPAVVEGVKGEWRVDPAQVERLDEEFQGRTALLSPFDRLSHDRVRAFELFGFEYTLEMYKPAAQRRWGYFALPILHLDKLVGKVDASADRRAGVLRIAAIHEDVRFTSAIRAGVDAELESLATWLGLTVECAWRG